jgi:hypothetical protein
MPELMIFKAGKYPQGDWPKERVQKLVDSYDPDKNIEAPVVIGHRYYGTDDGYQDAHGWVSGLRMDGAGKVFARIAEFSADVKKKIAEGKLRYVSAELYEFDKADEARPPYLKAVALLGRDTPAVAGTKISLFGLMAGGGLSIVDEKEHIAAFTRKAGAEEIKSLAGEGRREDKTMDELEKAKAETESLRAELAAEKEKAQAFQEEAAKLRDAGKKSGAEAFFAKLRDEGRLTPALFEKAVALDTRLGEEERKELRSMFSELNAKVDLSGTHAAPKAKGQGASGGEGGTLTAKIRAYQKEKHLSTFADAAEAMYAEKPELFEEGGGASTGGEA